MTPTPESVAAVDAAITSRHSMRAYLKLPVPRETIERILEVAARAPSGTNTQPWKVHVLTGEAKAELSRKVRAAFDDASERATHLEEYAYYPTQWVAPYIDRARSAGTCTACSASARPTRRACTSSTARTTISSARRSA
jgi:nitroreductase